MTLAILKSGHPLNTEKYSYAYCRQCTYDSDCKLILTEKSYFLCSDVIYMINNGPEFQGFCYRTSMNCYMVLPTPSAITESILLEPSVHRTTNTTTDGPTNSAISGTTEVGGRPNKFRCDTYRAFSSLTGIR